MSMCSDFGRVFEIGSAFRVEDSFTHTHLCEFIRHDVEMEIEDHFEVLDIVDRLFVAMFHSVNNNCQKELEAVGRQYPFEPLKYLPQTLPLTFEEGVQMLKDAGVGVDPLGDLNTASERKLGQLVLESSTSFTVTMPYDDNPLYSNSFDIFIRGEEIISAARRIHWPKFLEERAAACGIDVKTKAISTYIDSCSMARPHHLERAWSVR